MSMVVKTVTRWVIAFIFVYGIYIVAYGHISPGGGFAGGVILACGFVLLVLAWGKTPALAYFSSGAAHTLDSAGALAFLCLALLGLVSTQGLFFANFIQKSRPGTPLRLLSGGIIPLANIGIALKVCASLFLVMLVLTVLRVAASGDDSEFVSQED